MGILAIALATSLAAAPAPAAIEPPLPCPSCARFAPTTQPWQIQLSGEKIDASVKAPVYDFDGLDQPGSVVRKLRAKGRKTICYFNAGAWEPYRNDKGAFPTEVLGKRYEGFEDERWIDIRRIDVLAPIMRARMKVCKDKGFDAVDPDNVNGFENKTGFPLTAADQLAYDSWLANEAHRMGLAVGLKNDGPQVKRLAGHFDFAVVESCFEFDECSLYSPFVKAGKAVYAIEYERKPAQFCAQSKRLRFSAILKRLALGSFRQTCP